MSGQSILRPVELGRAGVAGAAHDDELCQVVDRRVSGASHVRASMHIAFKKQAHNMSGQSILRPVELGRAAVAGAAHDHKLCQVVDQRGVQSARQRYVGERADGDQPQAAFVCLSCLSDRIGRMPCKKPA